MPRNPVSLAKRIEVLTRIPAAWVLGVYEPTPSPGDDGAPTVPGGGSLIFFDDIIESSCGWTRTSNRPINSRMLCH